MWASRVCRPRVRYVLRSRRAADSGSLNRRRQYMPTRMAMSCIACVTQAHQSERKNMNQIIYIVGLVVIVIAILSFFGLR